METKMIIVSDKVMELLISFAPNLVSASLILFFGYILAKLLSKYIAKLLKKVTRDETLGIFFKNVIFVGVLLLTIITALTNLGVKTTSIIAVLGTAGLAIALSLKDSLTNLAAGILLVVLRFFNRGDTISVGSITGKVDSINLFETRLTTLDNQMVILPNSSIISSPVVNINANQTRRMDLIFGIDYKSDILQAKQVLESIFKEDEIVLSEPEPVVGVNALNASSIDLVVRFWVKSEHYFRAKIILTQKVKMAFDEKGIEIPYNKLDININPTQFPIIKDRQ
ncbi:mechanosensitive ion channel family protein [Helicobacter mesocricetorum]|uniref:mechanosensitive ion channel family protein n=1 Tax=Helicobacter mesocricetorum TaxID=87012 RepID=UPI001F3B962F|nr:mechanosensitive ion channel domain-containing protein [Helicobacter mesocricetorum]